MPLYEYQCQQCHRLTEKIQKLSDAPLTTCPHCGGALERTLTAAAVQFKGSGWYKDLYSSAKPAASSTADNATTAPSSGGEATSGSSSSSGEGASSAPAAPTTAAAPASPAAGNAKS